MTYSMDQWNRNNAFTRQYCTSAMYDPSESLALANYLDRIGCHANVVMELMRGCDNLNELEIAHRLDVLPLELREESCKVVLRHKSKRAELACEVSK